MTKPLVFNYKDHEELRQAYKELLADNQQLIADNRKLRQEVTELKQLNDGYVKIIAKNQETNNKLMASVQKQTGGDYISRADAIEVLNKLSTEGGNDAKMLFMDAKEWLSSLPSADAVSREDYEDIIKDYRKQYEDMNNEIADLETKLEEVVRCKDCRHAYFKDFDKYCPYMVGALKPNQFCSHGERKNK